ncbi:C80 family cysteine peptidase [Methylomonas sp. MK1]|uniref:C80 family cysteine peptidase n=1 Tax=Methylomonas sp. MK1 TaxID=1131552 RepID=UPI000365B3A9|nr:C80 family cysteine peptidase [Methylomonas sp. MK1]
MPNYDRQLIIQVLTSSGDESIKSGSEALNKRATQNGISSTVITYPAHASGTKFKILEFQLREQLVKLTDKSRVYIRGHGDWIEATSGGIKGEDMADTLHRLGMPRVKVISITSCKGARGAYFKSNLLSKGDQSFAGQFHARLHDHGIDTTVYARIHNVFVTDEGFAKKYGGKLGEKSTRDTFDAEPDEGIAAGDDKHVNHRPESKMKFEWKNGRQERNWVDYA